VCVCVNGQCSVRNGEQWSRPICYVTHSIC